MLPGQRLAWPAIGLEAIWFTLTAVKSPFVFILITASRICVLLFPRAKYSQKLFKIYKNIYMYMIYRKLKRKTYSIITMKDTLLDIFFQRVYMRTLYKKYIYFALEYFKDFPISMRQRDARISIYHVVRIIKFAQHHLHRSWYDVYDVCTWQTNLIYSICVHVSADS